VKWSRRRRWPPFYPHFIMGLRRRPAIETPPFGAISFGPSGSPFLPPFLPPNPRTPPSLPRRGGFGG
jgi:hypothetical protein